MKRCLSVVLAIALLLACAPVIPLQADAATVASGTCGDNLTWVLDNTGTLTVSGTGRMTNYGHDYPTPWDDYRSTIKSIIIEEGVTSVGSLAFSGCSSLISIEIPDSVTSIGAVAFAVCDSLASITIPDSVTSIGDAAFQDCSGLISVTIPDGVTSIGIATFIYCSSLVSVVIPERVTNIGIAAFSYCSSLITVYYQGTEEQKANIEIDSDNDPLISATWCHVETMVCEYWETGKDTATQYKTVEEALAVATSGTIKLLTDATADTILLKPGVTLDLNGYTLTADSVVVFNGAAITDGGEDCTGGGLLKVAEDNLGFMRENGLGVIPVWNGVDGYVFTKVTFQQLAQAAGEGAAQYIFLPTFSNTEAGALMADGGLDNGLKIKVSLTWNDEQCQQFYTYSEDLVQKVFDGTGRWVFSLTVTGISGIQDMTAQAVVLTDTGAQATASGTKIVPGEESTEDGTLVNPNEPIEEYGFNSFSIDVGAGEKKLVSIARAVDEATLCIYDKDAYVIYKGKTYTPSNGAIYIYMVSEGSFTPLELEIGNSGSAVKTFDVTFSFPEGTQHNPIKLNEGENTIACAAGNEQGTFYTFEASAAGTLTLDVLGIDPATVVCGIRISDMQPVPTVVELEEGSTTVSIELPAGAKAEIIFTTKDPNRDWKIPAAEITVNATFQ